jgi:GntR family transcriptional repressor for pyruvate dehydrogenase complex
VERSTDMRESAEMHREIYRAIRSHNPDEARKLMEQHLRLSKTAQGMERPTERKTKTLADAPKSRQSRVVTAN